MNALAIELAGESVLLHPARALVWPRRRTAFVADVHLGKGDLLRRHGLAVPSGERDRDLDRLATLIGQHGIERLIVLGDLVHARLPDQAPWLERLAEFRRTHAGMALQLVGGNHDRHADPQRLGVTALGPRWFEAPFVGLHEAMPDPQGFTLGGHIHPVLRMGTRHRPLRVPVFWQRPFGLTLPAFGELTGGYAIRPAAVDRLYAVGETVLALGT